MARKRKSRTLTYEPSKSRWDRTLLVLIILVAIGWGIYGLSQIDDEVQRQAWDIIRVLLIILFFATAWQLGARSTRKTVEETMNTFVQYQQGTKQADAAILRVANTLVQSNGKAESVRAQIERDNHQHLLREQGRTNDMERRLEQRRLFESERAKRAEELEQKRLEQRNADSGVEQYDYTLIDLNNSQQQIEELF